MDFAEQTTQSEYIYTLFSLKDSSNIDGDIYLVGGLNNYVRTALNKLTYNTEQKTWETVQLLKQGVYDYEYVLDSADKTQISNFLVLTLIAKMNIRYYSIIENPVLTGMKLLDLNKLLNKIIS